MGGSQQAPNNEWPLAHYQNVSENLRRYRDYRWKIPIWTAGFLLGLGAAGLKMPLDPWVRILAGMVAVGTAVLAIWNLHRCYDAYVNHKKCLDDYESARCDLQKVASSCTSVYWRSECCRKVFHCPCRALSWLASRLLPRIMWPKWKATHEAHRFFRLGWFGLIIATAVFAGWAMWVGPRKSKPAAPGIMNVVVVPVGTTQVNIQRGTLGAAADSRRSVQSPQPAWNAALDAAPTDGSNSTE